MKQYLSSIFSPKKLLYKGVSLFAVWDSKTKFTDKTHLRRFSKLCNVQIGRYSRIQIGSEAYNANIGNFSVISFNSVIGPGAHPMNYITANSIFYRDGGWPWHKDWIQKIDFDEHKQIVIGNDVWIGMRCIVMEGVHIGDGATIAAGAIVTKDVPPYAIVGGIPGKILKYKYSQDIIDRLLEIQWWNLSDEEIKKHLPLFHKANLTMADLDEHFPRRV